MNLTPDEARALAFIGGLVLLSAVVRVVDRPRPVTADLPGVDVAALEAATAAEIATAGKKAKPLANGERLDPNVATATELMRLPRARRNVVDAVVAARASGTRFETLADLDRVPGVGQVTLDAWRPHLTLREPPAPPKSGDGGSATTRGERARPVTEGSGGGEGEGTRGTGEPLDLNRATQQQLERLPGVGPALAKRIIAYRDSVGALGSVDQLERVRGIGPATVARLRPLVKTGG